MFKLNINIFTLENLGHTTVNRDAGLHVKKSRIYTMMFSTEKSCDENEKMERVVAWLIKEEFNLIDLLCDMEQFRVSIWTKQRNERTKN